MIAKTPAPTLAFAWMGRWQWRETFKLFPAPLALLAGGALLGIGLGPWINLISGLQQIAATITENSAGPILIASRGIDLREGDRKGLIRHGWSKPN